MKLKAAGGREREKERESTIKGIEKQKRRLTEILVSGDERRAALMCVIQLAVELFAGFCKVLLVRCAFSFYAAPVA